MTMQIFSNRIELCYLGTQTGADSCSSEPIPPGLAVAIRELELRGGLSWGGGRMGKVLVRCSVSRMSLSAASTRMSLREVSTSERWVVDAGGGGERWVVGAGGGGERGGSSRGGSSRVPPTPSLPSPLQLPSESTRREEL